MKTRMAKFQEDTAFKSGDPKAVENCWLRVQNVSRPGFLLEAHGRWGIGAEDVLALGKNVRLHRASSLKLLETLEAMKALPYETRIQITGCPLAAFKLTGRRTGN